jgi:hypothetical protein
MGRDDEGSYRFAKLKGSENYKEWACEMSFALQDVGLMGHVTGETKQLPEYTDDQLKEMGRGLDAQDRVDRRQEAREKWATNNRRTVGKIGAMCIKAVQQEFQVGWNATTCWNSLMETNPTGS